MKVVDPADKNRCFSRVVRAAEAVEIVVPKCFF